MARAEALDPFMVHRFQIFMIGGSTVFGGRPLSLPFDAPVGGATQISFPEFSVDIQDFQEGNKGVPTKLIGKGSWSSIEIQKGVFLLPSGFAEWVRQYQEKNTDLRRGLFIASLHRSMDVGPDSFPGLNVLPGGGGPPGPPKVLQLEDCAIENYKAHSDLNSEETEVAFESITIQPERGHFRNF